MLSSRLAKQLKAQFTKVNEHFHCEHNVEIDVFLQKLSTKVII